MNLLVSLIHYPIRDRAGRIVATNITNLDVHDIARASRVYGVAKYFIVHPLEDQRIFVSRMLDHWRTGEGSVLNPMRQTALTMISLAQDLDDVRRQWPRPLRLVATHARTVNGARALKYAQLRAALRGEQDLGVGEDEDLLLIFGTGFGLTDDFMQQCDYLLEPVRGRSKDDYRHLSVRSAVSIILDRLLGE